MPPLPYTSCADAPFGALFGPLPELVDIPEGSRVRLRFRNNDFWKAFIRHSNGQVSGWYVDWHDKEKNQIRLKTPFAINKVVTQQ